jgi:hypothetical protein
MQFCGGTSPPILNEVKSLFVSAFAPVIQTGVAQAIDGKVCASP